MLADWLWLPSISLAALATASCFAWAHNSRGKKTISLVALGLAIILAAMAIGSRSLHEPHWRDRFGASVGYGFLAEYGLLAVFATALCCSWVYKSRGKKALTCLALGLAYSLAPFVMDKLHPNPPFVLFVIVLPALFPFGIGGAFAGRGEFYPLLAANSVVWAAVFYYLSSIPKRAWRAWHTRRPSDTVAPDQRPKD